MKPSVRSPTGHLPRRPPSAVPRATLGPLRSRPLPRRAALPLDPVMLPAGVLVDAAATDPSPRSRPLPRRPLPRPGAALPRNPVALSADVLVDAGTRLADRVDSWTGTYSRFSDL